MLTFIQYITEAKKSSGVPGRGGEGWGSSSDDQSALERAAEHEAEQRLIALEKRKQQEAEKQAERERQEAEKQAQEERLKRAMREYGFAQYWSKPKENQ